MSGRVVVVTRPLGQAEVLIAGIHQRGGEVIEFPLIEIDGPVDFSSLDRVLARLDDFSLAFFVSPNAVRFTLARLSLTRGVWPHTLQVATVGRGSERALHEAGFEHVVAPVVGFDSEAVLALNAFSPEEIVGRQVVIGSTSMISDICP